MIRLVIFSILLHGIFCENYPFFIATVTPEKNKPVTLPPNAGTDVIFYNINGTLTSDSLAQLSVVKLELRVSKADQLEPGAACSPPALKSLSLDLESALITVTRETLKNCEKLVKLSLTGHYIAIDALTHLPNLRDLRLFDLNLHNVTKEYFRNLSSLETLSLKNCLIRKIDRDAFSELTNLKHLFIKSDCAQSLNVFSEIAIKVQNFTFEVCKVRLTKLNLEVTELWFRVSEQLDDIAAGAVCPTSSVRKLTLDFSTSNSINITKETLQNCENLEDLWIKADYACPSEITADAFHNLANLKNFSSDYVKMSQVTKDTFKNSLLLENLRLCNGWDIEVDSDAFNHLQHLKTVEICLHWDHDNRVNTQKLFANTLKADKLTFKHLSGKLSLPQSKEIKELSLQFINLKETESGVCSSPTLKKFSLTFFPTDNCTLKKDAFNCENLEELFLTAAALHSTVLPEEAFQHLPHLKILSLTWQNFNPLKREYFKSLQSLEKLVLNECFINEIQSDAFEDLINLKFLKISTYHELKQLPVNLFRKNVKLETLQLPSLTEELNWEMFKELPHLTSLLVSSQRRSSFNVEKIAQNVPNLRYFKNDNEIDFIGDEEYNLFKEELKKFNVTIVPEYQSL